MGRDDFTLKNILFCFSMGHHCPTTSTHQHRHPALRNTTLNDPRRFLNDLATANAPRLLFFCGLILFIYLNLDCDNYSAILPLTSRSPVVFLSLFLFDPGRYCHVLSSLDLNSRLEKGGERRLVYFLGFLTCLCSIHVSVHVLLALSGLELILLFRCTTRFSRCGPKHRLSMHYMEKLHFV